MLFAQMMLRKLRSVKIICANKNFTARSMVVNSYNMVQGLEISDKIAGQNASNIKLFIVVKTNRLGT